MAKPERKYYTLESLRQEWKFQDVKEVLYLAVSGDLKICCMAHEWEFEYGFFDESANKDGSLIHVWRGIGFPELFSGPFPLSEKNIWEIATSGSSRITMTVLSEDSFREKLLNKPAFCEAIIDCGIIRDELFIEEEEEKEEKKDFAELNRYFREEIFRDSDLSYDVFEHDIQLGMPESTDAPIISANDLFVTNEEKERVEKEVTSGKASESEPNDNVWKTIGALVLFLKHKHRDYVKSDGKTNYSKMVSDILSFLTNEKENINGIKKSKLDERFKKGVKILEDRQE